MSDEEITNLQRPRRGRWLRWGLVTLIGCAILSLPLLNLFLMTPIGRGLVAKKLSGAVHMPVTVGSASYTPWGGVRLKNLRIDQLAAAQSIVSDPFFEAASFEAEVSLISLLSDRVVIERLICDSPKISLVRGDGREVIVADRDKAQAGAVQATPGTGSDEDSRPEKGVENGAPPTPNAPAKAGRRPVAVPANAHRRFELGEVEVRHGTLRVSSYDGIELIRIDGLRVALDFSKAGEKGSLNFDRASLLGGLGLENFASPLEIEGGQMILKGLEAECGGGRVSGEIAFDRKQRGMPFLANLAARGVELTKLLEENSMGLKSGKVAGNLVLRGLAKAPESVEGGGQLRVESAVINPGSEYEKLRSAMDVDGAGNVKLDPAQASFAIRKGVLSLREASLGSGRLLVKSVGKVWMDGTLNVAVRLYLGANLYSAVRSKPVPGRVILKFERLEGTDWFYRDELLTGKLNDPRVDFWRTGVPVPPAEVMSELSFDFEARQGDAIGR